ncbi:hypothetical protein OIU74_010530 [Salix koriyanagi]|uniref:Uncharacterized protein n=1 Tax=Salix koriyanagi TaxID=2511006 RepID=A0A9Q0TD59_9ROSI|nr:hypothetical protein OIU74_010530 [Salix koriyanagi]
MVTILDSYLHYRIANVNDFFVTLLIGGPDQVLPHFKLSGQQLDSSSATDSFEGAVNRWHVGPKWLPLSIRACSKSNGTCRLVGGGLGHCHHHLAGNGCFSFHFRPSLAVESESDGGAPESGRASTPPVFNLPARSLLTRSTHLLQKILRQ